MTDRLPGLVGMVHLLALPGSPRFGGSVDEVVATAVEDARILVAAGFPALIVENFGDVPFFADEVPAETVAAMSVATAAVASCGVPFGVNVLRNDGSAALGIAASTGASLIRVNVLAGLMNTDQGPMVGRAAELLRKRAALCPDVEIWADVMVKHASPPPGLDAAQAALDTVERGLADALIVSGSGTGAEVDLEQAREVAGAVPEETRIVIGSGATADNLESVMTLADSVIVGSWLKIDGVATNRPDPARVGEFVRQASASGLL